MLTTSSREDEGGKVELRFEDLNRTKFKDTENISKSTKMSRLFNTGRDNRKIKAELLSRC